jgi:hypothetical protein
MMKWEYLVDYLYWDTFDERYYWEDHNGWFSTEKEALDYLGSHGYELTTKNWDDDKGGDEYIFKLPISED